MYRILKTEGEIGSYTGINTAVYFFGSVINSLSGFDDLKRYQFFLPIEATLVIEKCLTVSQTYTPNSYLTV